MLLLRWWTRIPLLNKQPKTKQQNNSSGSWNIRAFLSLRDLTTRQAKVQFPLCGAIVEQASTQQQLPPLQDSNPRDTSTFATYPVQNIHSSNRSLLGLGAICFLLPSMRPVAAVSRAPWLSSSTATKHGSRLRSQRR